MISVRTSFGHAFGQESEGGEAKCDRCGGSWLFLSLPEETPSYTHTYEAGNGNDPVHCPDTHREHGEAPCQTGRDGNGCKASQEGPCVHTDHDCNCLFCV